MFNVEVGEWWVGGYDGRELEYELSDILKSKIDKDLTPVYKAN